jgi:hypothetical protein
MPTSWISTGWDSDTLSVGASQEQESTTGNLVNSADQPVVRFFHDSLREWLALRSVQSPTVAQVQETSQKSPAEFSQTLPVPPPTPLRPKRPDSVVGLKRWTGLILEIAHDLMTVELTPTDHEGPRFHAEFELSLLAPDDEVAGPGDIVYLTTRYVRAKSGYSTVTTELRLRRTGQWSEREVAEIRELAEQHAAYFRHVD